MLERKLPRVPHPTDYAPYHEMREFNEGFAAYGRNDLHNPHHPNSVAAQAWDRGADYAYRLRRLEQAR